MAHVAYHHEAGRIHPSQFMSTKAMYVVGGICIGIGATLLMDLWNLFLKRVFNVPSLDYCLLGRWVGHIPSGTVRHASIGKSAPRRFECPLGWMTHYFIGVTLALVLILLTSGSWLLRPSLTVALIYGIATVVFPFFVLQPSLGLGIASSKAPNPAQARLKSLATHTVFGIGLYLCGLAMSSIIRFV